MIRILHIVHVLTRGGGLCNFIMNYYRRMDRTKIQFDFLYFKEVESDFKEEITALGGRYFRLEEPSPREILSRKAWQFLAQHQGEFTAIHCHALFAAAVYAHAARRHGIRHIIVHSHSTSYSVGIVRQCRNWLLVWVARHFATVKMACSTDAAVFMFGTRAVANGDVLIISNAIDVNRYAFNPAVRDAVRGELGLSDQFVVGHIGGFVELKNHSRLVEIFKRVLQAESDAVLLLIGGEGTVVSSTRQGIEAKIESMGIRDHVRFLGIRNDIHRLMAAMDVFVFPSVFEGFGLVLIEAQASGLPSVASSVIPDDVRILDTLSILPEYADNARWCEEILSITKKGSTRAVNSQTLQSHDIARTCARLESIYLNL